MKASELRSKSQDELRKELGDLLRAGCALRMRTPRTSQTSEIRKLGRDIARVRTVMREKVGAQ